MRRRRRRQRDKTMTLDRGHSFESSSFSSRLATDDRGDLVWRVANEKRSSRTLIRPWIHSFLLPFPFTAVSLFIVNRATSFQAQRGIVGRNEARLDLKRPCSESESEKKKKAKALVGNDGCCHSVTILISWPPLVASAVVVVATVVGLFLKKEIPTAHLALFLLQPFEDTITSRCKLLFHSLPRKI